MENLMIENAKILFRNFAGKEGKYNREGERSFCVLLRDRDEARRLLADGWNVKPLKPRDEDDEQANYISVSVSYKNIPPKVYLIAHGKRTLLDEDSVGELDYADIASADLVISPYEWEVNGKSGVKAYLKTAYITLEEDIFARKYERYSLPSDSLDDEDDEELPF